jgi:hypothetical protein
LAKLIFFFSNPIFTISVNPIFTYSRWLPVKKQISTTGILDKYPIVHCVYPCEYINIPSFIVDTHNEQISTTMCPYNLRNKEREWEPVPLTSLKVKRMRASSDRGKYVVYRYNPTNHTSLKTKDMCLESSEMWRANMSI